MEMDRVYNRNRIYEDPETGKRYLIGKSLSQFEVGSSKIPADIGETVMEIPHLSSRVNIDIHRSTLDSRLEPSKPLIIPETPEEKRVNKPNIVDPKF